MANQKTMGFCLSVIFVVLSFSAAARSELIFSENMEGDLGTRWIGHNCKLSFESEYAHSKPQSLKIVDEATNAQAYRILTTEPGRKYRVSGWARRLKTNTGHWTGLIAVSSIGGDVDAQRYLSRSNFISKPDEWEKLELTFVAQGKNTFLILAGQNGTGDMTYFDDIEVVSSEEQMKKNTDDPMITLAGSPRTVGLTWGRINKDIIRSDMDRYFLEPAKNDNISREELIRRGKRFEEISKQIAPHWIEEARAVAESAGVDPELYISFIANVHRNLFLSHECTSYTVCNKYTQDNTVLFHKNRDNADKAQAVFILDSEVEGINKFMTVSDASLIACMMMVNDKGLAGSADTGGSLPVKEPRYRGMMNTFLLRYIAERASTCEEALAIIQDFLKKGYYAGGHKTGTHWLFVDKEGKILEISNNSTTLVHKYHTEKVYFSVRENTPAAQFLQAAEPPIGFHAFHDISRDPSICFSSSISGMTVEIDRNHPDLLTCAWFTLPAKSLAFPLFMGGQSTPVSLLNGEVYSVAKGIQGQTDLWEEIERFTYLNKQVLVEKAARLIGAKKTDEAKRLLDTWVEKYQAAHFAWLQKAK